MATSKNSALAKSVNEFGRQLNELKSSGMTMGQAQPQQHHVNREFSGGYRVVGNPQSTKQQQSGNMMQKLMMFMMFVIMLGMGGKMLLSKPTPTPSPVASTPSTPSESQGVCSDPMSAECAMAIKQKYANERRAAEVVQHRERCNNQQFDAGMSSLAAAGGLPMGRHGVDPNKVCDELRSGNIQSARPWTPYEFSQSEQ